VLSRLKIGPKLLLAPAVVLLLLILSSSASYYVMVRHNQAFEVIVHERAARMRQAGELLAESQQAHANVYQLLTWMSASFSEPRVDALGREITQRHGSIGRRFAALGQATRGGAGEQRLLVLAQAAFVRYMRDVGDVLELSENDHSMSTSAMYKAERSFDVVEGHLAALAAAEQSLSERALASARADFSAAATLLPVLVALSVALSLAITMVVRSALLKEVGAIGSAASGLAHGDLTVPRRSYGRDEISETARALDASIRNLNRTLRDIRGTARTVDSGSREVAAGSEALAQRAEEMTAQDRRRVMEAAAAASALQKQALALSREVSGFKLDEMAAPPAPALAPVGGQGRTTNPAKPARAHLWLAAARPRER
jgi:methyl-accepting chemotaxis protein